MTPTTRTILASAALAGSLFMTARAQAQTCAADKDCPQGFACVQSAVNSTTPACPPGGDCPKVAPSPPAPVYYCEPKACKADTDCGTGMVCYSETSTACSGGSAVPPCAPNTECPKPVATDPVCTTTTRSICAFKWQLPCQNDAACGDGFTCHPSVVGACSGSGGTGTAGSASTSSGSGTTPSTGDNKPPASSPAPSDAGTPPDTMCTTTTSYPGSCAPTATTCTADTDCPGGWKCTEVPTAVSGGGSTGVAMGQPEPVPPPSDAGTATSRPADTSPPSPGTVSKVCASPYGLGVPRDATGQGEVSTGPGATGSTGNAGGGPGSQPPATPGTSGSMSSPAGGGCSIDSSTDASHFGGLILLTILGILGVRRLRRI